MMYLDGLSTSPLHTYVKTAYNSTSNEVRLTNLSRSLIICHINLQIFPKDRCSRLSTLQLSLSNYRSLACGAGIYDLYEAIKNNRFVIFLITKLKTFEIEKKIKLHVAYVLFLFPFSDVTASRLSLISKCTQPKILLTRAKASREARANTKQRVSFHTQPCHPKGSLSLKNKCI